MATDDSLIPSHAGFRELKSFQLAQLCYDLTVLFCDRFVEKRSRTHDQMVQAARSGVQNIAEGSQASGTSKKMELKLTSVARASLEELRLDYEDFLRQRGLAQWKGNHPTMVRFKGLRCSSVEQVRLWVRDEMALKGAGTGDTDEHGLARTAQSDAAKREKERAAQYAANGVLALLNVTCYLLDRQMQAQAKAFLDEGGFTERLYRLRSERRRRDKP